MVVVRIREKVIHVGIIQLRIIRIPQLRPSLVHIHLAVVFPLLKPVGIFPFLFFFTFFFLAAFNSLLLALDTTSYTSSSHEIMVWNRRCFTHIIAVDILIFTSAEVHRIFSKLFKLWYLVKFLRDLILSWMKVEFVTWRSNAETLASLLFITRYSFQWSAIFLTYVSFSEYDDCCCTLTLSFILLHILCFVMWIIASDALTKKWCVFFFVSLIICARILWRRIRVLPWDPMLQTVFVYYTQVLGWSSFIDL